MEKVRRPLGKIKAYGVITINRETGEVMGFVDTDYHKTQLYSGWITPYSDDCSFFSSTSFLFGLRTWYGGHGRVNKRKKKTINKSPFNQSQFHDTKNKVKKCLTNLGYDPKMWEIKIVRLSSPKCPIKVNWKRFHNIAFKVDKASHFNKNVVEGMKLNSLMPFKIR